MANIQPIPSRVTFGRAEVNGIRMYYRMAGSGEAVVLLHGFGLEKLYDADKYPRMYHLPLFEAPNGLAEALIAGRERMFVRHFMRQQAYNIAALEDDVLDGYADRLAAPGALRAGIAYFRAHKIDAEHNRENARTKLSMPVLTVGGSASAGADLESEVRPLVESIRGVVMENCGHYLAEEQPERLIKISCHRWKHDSSTRR